MKLTDNLTFLEMEQNEITKEYFYKCKTNTGYIVLLSAKEYDRIRGKNKKEKLCTIQTT